MCLINVLRERHNESGGVELPSIKYGGNLNGLTLIDWFQWISIKNIKFMHNNVYRVTPYLRYTFTERAYES